MPEIRMAIRETGASARAGVMRQAGKDANGQIVRITPRDPLEKRKHPGEGDTQRLPVKGSQNSVPRAAGREALVVSAAVLVELRVTAGRMPPSRVR